ncbi:hypothetical protein GHT09_002406 [Marmota monax]|uniref:Uncharacterized protein n=1 Tax=Marmota monax TaxID=9995 RepID=A0A834V8L4_MARMO|nr:hypothetical protein GHT09_002406 [Marmota monax]
MASETPCDETAGAAWWCVGANEMRTKDSGGRGNRERRRTECRDSLTIKPGPPSPPRRWARTFACCHSPLSTGHVTFKHPIN